MMFLSLYAVMPMAYAYTPHGWLWGDEFQQKKEDKPKDTVAFNTLNPDEQVAVLRAYTLSAIHAMDVDPTPENAKNVAEWLQFWTGKATGAVQAYRQMLLENPSLDYHLTHPSESAALSVTNAQIQEKEKQAIAVLSNAYGIFYFYRGNDPYDQKLAPIIQHFSERYQVTVMPVSVDGVIDPTFPQSRFNEGQTETLGVSHFPALMLVNPITHEVKPLNYGFITEDALARRFYQVATDFKGETW